VNRTDHTAGCNLHPVSHALRLTSADTCWFPPGGALPHTRLVAKWQPLNPAGLSFATYATKGGAASHWRAPDISGFSIDKPADRHWRFEAFSGWLGWLHTLENIGARSPAAPVGFLLRASEPWGRGVAPCPERTRNSQWIVRLASLVLRAALCGTFAERSVAAGSRLTRIRSRNYVLRQRVLALPKTLNLLVKGSIPSGLTIIPLSHNHLRIHGWPSPSVSPARGRTVEQPNRIGHGTRTEVHVLLRRRQIAMSRQFLNRACWRALHRKMRTER
jgi:hypothetical protein